MSFFQLFIVCVLAIVAYLGLDWCISKIRSRKYVNNADIDETICYHTHLDCDNCLNATSCHQIDGLGLVKPARKDD